MVQALPIRTITFLVLQPGIDYALILFKHVHSAVQIEIHKCLQTVQTRAYIVEMCVNYTSMAYLKTPPKKEPASARNIIASFNSQVDSSFPCSSSQQPSSKSRNQC